MTVSYRTRPARPADTEGIFRLIQALADYEKLATNVTGTVEALNQHLFGPSPTAEVVVADLNDQIVGFALFFANYSTFLTQRGLYLEDLFVLPDYRRQGIGNALLTHVAHIAAERGAGRLEWSVLDWNQGAIAFYESMGAQVMPDWRICRMTQETLQKFQTST